MARIDYERVGADYDNSRSLPSDALSGWAAAVADAVAGVDGPGWTLDLGAGTGVFASALAGWTGRRVVAVEPAAAMRAAGVAKPSAAGWVGGAASFLPLRAGSCAVAWLSTVIHHVPDLGLAAAELRRVLAPGSVVLIRSAFPGRLDAISLFRYFPEAGAVAATFPSVEEVVSTFGAVGFTFVSLAGVAQTSTPSLAGYRERVQQRVDTTLAPLSDEQFAAGLARIDADLAEHGDREVVDRLDLLVLQG